MDEVTKSEKTPQQKEAIRQIMEPDKGPKWLLPLIFVSIGAFLVIFCAKTCNDTRPNSTVVQEHSGHLATKDAAQADEQSSSAEAAAPVSTSLESIKVKLPNGKELDAYKGGIEGQLVAFLSGDWKSLSADSLKNKWFDFDNLNFNTGTATLKPESEKQLDNIAEILKAFPDAKIKIGGYTDATGNSAANKKLSQGRADAAKNGLDKRGVGKQVTGAEGYGSQYAKYPATATDAEKASDRHVSISVRK